MLIWVNAWERLMPLIRQQNKDAYSLILEAIDIGIYKPGDRLVESDLADSFGVSRTPIREALQRLETQSLLTRDGRSLIVSSLDHSQMAELYIVRAELEGLAANLAAKHATSEEVKVLQDMVDSDRKIISDPSALARSNRRFHKQIHLASHNRFDQAIRSSTSIDGSYGDNLSGCGWSRRCRCRRASGNSYCNRCRGL